MTPREPDRFEEKAKELCLTEWRSIAAALRQAADDALERAAQDFDQEAERLEQDARKLDADGQGAGAAAHFHYGRVAEENAKRIRALASPAAAPAAETDAPNGPVCGCGRPSRYESGWCGETSCFANVTPPSEPAAPEKDLLPPCTCHYAAAEFCKYHGPRLRAERAASVAPAPLLPRVLAALEAEATDAESEELTSLAAELRAYIAKAKGEGT